MKQKDSQILIEISPWEPITLRKILSFEERSYPNLIRVGELMYGVTSSTAREFISFLVRIFRDYEISIEDKGSKYQAYSSIKELNKVKWSEEGSEEIYKKVADSSFLVKLGSKTIGKAKNRLDQIIEAFMLGNTYSFDLHSLGESSYRYGYQKKNFINNISTYTNKYGSSFKISARKDFGLFGEERRKTHFLETLLALEHEDLIDLDDLYHSQIYGDLFAQVTIQSKAAGDKSKPPELWKLIEVDTKAVIKRNDKTVFTFPSNTSNKYRHFKCLWDHYGQRVLYPKVYEYQTKLKYPHKRGKNHQINSQMRNTVNKLRKEFQEKELPITIVTNRGFVLTVEE